MNLLFTEDLRACFLDYTTAGDFLKRNVVVVK